MKHSPSQKGSVAVGTFLASLALAAASTFFPIAKTNSAPIAQNKNSHPQTQSQGITETSASLDLFRSVSWSSPKPIKSLQQKKQTMGQLPDETAAPQDSLQNIVGTFTAPFASISQPSEKTETQAHSLPIEQFFGGTELVSVRVSGPQDYSPTGPTWTNARVTAYWPGGGTVESVSQTPRYDRNGIPYYTEALGGRVVTAEDYRHYLTGDPNYSFASVGVTAAAYINNAPGYDTGVPSYRGNAYVIPEYTYTNARGETYTIANMPVVVRDQGGAFRITGRERGGDAERADKLDPNSPNYIYNKMDIATDLGSKEHPGSQLDRGKNNRSQVQLIPTNNVAGAGSHVNSTGSNGSASQNGGGGSGGTSYPSSGGGVAGSSIPEGIGTGMPAGVGAWVEHPQCYKHMGGPGGSSQYDNIQTCNSGFACVETDDDRCGEQREVKDCGKRERGADKTENQCEEEAMHRRGLSTEGDGAYACLWLACKKGNNSIYDPQTKRCGCDDGRGLGSSGLAAASGPGAPNPGTTGTGGTPLPPPAGNGKVRFATKETQKEWESGQFGNGIPINRNLYKMVDAASNQFGEIYISDVGRFNGVTAGRGTSSQHNDGDAIDMRINYPGTNTIDPVRTAQLAQFVYEHAPEYNVYQSFYSPVNGQYTLNLSPDATNGRYVPYAIHNRNDYVNHFSHLHVGVKN